MDGWKVHYNPIAKLQHCPCQFGTVSGLEVHGMLLWSIASLPTVAVLWGVTSGFKDFSCIN